MTAGFYNKTLEDQRTEMDTHRVNMANAGRKGALAKLALAQAKPSLAKASLSQTEPSLSHIEEERRVEKRREEGEKQATPDPKPHDFSADPEQNIPEGMAVMQYSTFVLEACNFPASYALKVKMGDALEILAKETRCLLNVATA